MTKRLDQRVRIIDVRDGREIGSAHCRAVLPSSGPLESLKLPDIRLDEIRCNPGFSPDDLALRRIRLVFQGEEEWTEGEIESPFIGPGSQVFIAAEFSKYLRP